jgi:hypothetical protein
MISSLGALGGATPEQARAAAPGSAQALDDAARVTAGGLGDVLAGTMGAATSGDLSQTPEMIRKEAEKTIAAKIRLKMRTGSDMAPAVLETVGDAGKVLALPGGAFATPLRAALTGAATEVGSTAVNRLQSGEKLTDGLDEYRVRAEMGAAGGFGGYYLGKFTNTVLKYLGVGDKSLTDAAETLVNKNKKIVEDAASAMEQSGVGVNRGGMQRLTRQINNTMNAQSISPYSTPKAYDAWTEIRRVASTGQPITLQGLNDLKERIARDALYDAGGVLKDGATETDKKLITQMSKMIDDFMKDLPNKRMFVIGGAGGKLQEGLSAWGKMQDFQQRVFRNERLMELVAKAETAARSGTISFENSLQQEFSSFWNGNRTLIKNLYNTPQQNAIRKIAEGDISKRAFNILDRWMGSTLFAPVTRVMQSTFGAAFEAEESRLAARKLLETTAGSVMRSKGLPELGAKAGITYADTKTK